MAKTEKLKGKPEADETRGQHPTVYVSAGPNGAGKTTFAASVATERGYGRRPCESEGPTGRT